MRFWVGNEMEGPRAGVRTLFIESPVLCRKEHAEKILKAVELARPDALYFGAGRTDTLFVRSYALQSVLTDNRVAGKLITIETSNLNYLIPVLQTVIEFDIMVVHRVDVSSNLNFKELSRFVYSKVDDTSNVFMSKFELQFENSLSDLKDGQYQGTDVEIKVEEEKK